MRPVAARVHVVVPSKSTSVQQWHQEQPKEERWRQQESAAEAAASQTLGAVQCSSGSGRDGGGRSSGSGSSGSDRTGSSGGRDGSDGSGSSGGRSSPTPWNPKVLTNRAIEVAFSADQLGYVAPVEDWRAGCWRGSGKQKPCKPWLLHASMHRPCTCNQSQTGREAQPHLRQI